MRQVEGTDRIESFSDGVFAIGMTLLILQIKVPIHNDVGGNQLLRELLDIWPSYLAFITSFLTILVIWVKHHWMISLIEKTDHAFLYWNGLLLFFITFLPFPTALLAEYLLHPDGKVAATLYAGTLLAISLAFRALWRHANVKKLLEENSTRAATSEARQLTQQNRLGPPLYLVAFVISFFYEGASVGLCLFLTLFFSFRDWSAKA